MNPSSFQSWPARKDPSSLVLSTVKESAIGEVSVAVVGEEDAAVFARLKDSSDGKSGVLLSSYELVDKKKQEKLRLGKVR